MTIIISTYILSNSSHIYHANIVFVLRTLFLFIFMV